MAYEPEPRNWEQKDWLYEQYWGEMKSVRQIADEVGMGKHTVSKSFDKLGIPRRTVGYLPENSISPFKGFYNGDENAQTDEQSRKHFDPDAERSEKPDWADIAEEDPAVGESATFSD